MNRTSALAFMLALCSCSTLTPRERAAIGLKGAGGSVACGVETLSKIGVSSTASLIGDALACALNTWGGALESGSADAEPPNPALAEAVTEAERCQANLEDAPTREHKREALEAARALAELGESGDGDD